MTRAKPLLAGGAAAIVLAGAAQLFPGFDKVQSVAVPNGHEFASSRSAFERLIAEPRGALGGLEEFGFAAGKIDDVHDAVLLREAPQDCAGRGIYWLREGSESRLAITAPHRGSDRHTGMLAASLFQETKARAAAWNSAPRRPTSNCSNAIDLAREKDHTFSAFGLAFADAIPDGLMVQLHGFDGAHRHTRAAQDAAMIISNGTNKPSERLLDIADCLSLAFAPSSVLVYPGDTGELGALTNAQGQLLNAAGFDGFVHLEIAAGLREAMIEDASLRAKLAACLMEDAR